ncbi:carbohydrate ABC transporter permease [Paenibacillus eucommiae]|uniref:ABC-type glycerol-3-phosphate transport system permease component n=1 Tax=Paenibacillus eucommiae TaxID=1355755 RepID=A0ABS4IT56_9BACL|nr:carbohydrate ABC transporter permease [Paenibacillus eucommiae]MBP1990738.1 ABC-type glycerol-3-phosphate transport system permease component [Paenibacillus eucommiae]
MKQQKWTMALINYSLLALISIVLLVPFMVMLTTALKDSATVLSIPPEIIPVKAHWSNFMTAIEKMDFLLLLRNTLIHTVSVIIGTLISCSLVAYGFARLQFAGRNFWFLVLIVTMIIPGQITMIPMYIMMRWVGWIDTFYPLIVPAFFGTAFYIFLMRQFFMTIPRELDDAATIDGCGPFRIFYRIMLPLVKPVLATITIFTFMGIWNDFLGPLIYLQSDNMKTLSLGLYVFQGTHATEWNLLMAASIIVMLPCLLIFFFFQRYFIEGAAVSGIKG